MSLRLGNQIIAGALADTSAFATKTELAGKVNTSDLTECAVVIESKRPTAEDPTWYRLYSDGWVEQGGYVQPTGASSKEVILPVEMESNLYTCVLTPAGNDNDTGGWGELQIVLCGNGGTYNYLFGKSTTRIRVSSTSSAGFNWIIKGYAAE